MSVTNEHFDLTGLPERPAKPRTEGLTLILDKGLAPRQVENILAAAADSIDMAKLGWGTAAITPALERKIAIYREADVHVYFGGTLFEAFYMRDQLPAYCTLLRRLGVQHVEVSDGSICMPPDEKLSCIRRLARDFVVLSEVGSKDKETVTPPYKWVEHIQNELEAGSWKVVCEARESGTAGIFRGNGKVREGLIDEIVDLLDHRRIVFEAPRKEQQVWFLQQLGSNVNLGNIAPEEVISLETLRLGLRGDTLFTFFEPSKKSPNVMRLVPQRPSGTGGSDKS